MLVIYKVAR